MHFVIIDRLANLLVSSVYVHRFACEYVSSKIMYSSAAIQDQST